VTHLISIVLIQNILVPLHDEKLLLKQVGLVLKLWVPGHERLVGKLRE
jgi:hypothetical protein